MAALVMLFISTKVMIIRVSVVVEALDAAAIPAMVAFVAEYFRIRCYIAMSDL